MLAAVFAWWQEQMRDLVPASLRPFGQGWRRELVADVAAAGAIDLFLRGRGGVKVLSCSPFQAAGMEIPCLSFKLFSAAAAG
jgi:hypothetical protein